jgi:hypothetical protein
MKKLLLSLAAVIGLGSLANAATVTTTVADKFGTATISGISAWTVDGVTFTPDKGEGSTAPAFNKALDVRLYAKNTLTVTAPGNITSISFAISTQGLKQYAEITPSVGAITEQGANPLKWTGEATSVTFTVGSDNTYGSSTSSKSGQLDFTAITVVYEASDNFVATPTFSVKGGTYYDAQSVELTQAEADAIYYTLDGTTPTTASTKYEGAIEVAETTTIKAIAVKGENASEVVEAEYVIEKRAEANSIAEAKEQEGEFVINFSLTVGYAAYSNVFVTDGTDFIQIYKSGIGDGLKQGDVIPAGWNATYTCYNNVTPELVPAGSLPAVTEGTFTAKEVEAADVTAALVNSVVVVKNVVFEEATPSEASNFSGKVGETELTFRNSYKLASVDAGTYNVEAVVNVYSSTVQLYPISYTEVTTTSVLDAAVDNAAGVEYFNLQGVRVANPENGLFIRRQGNKVSKVLVR